jgi:hypothetical protein
MANLFVNWKIVDIFICLIHFLFNQSIFTRSSYFINIRANLFIEKLQIFIDFLFYLSKVHLLANFKKS